MSISKLSADLNDIPSITHLPKFSTSVIKPEAPFTFNLKQDQNESKIRVGTSHYEENDENSPDLEKPENMLLEIYGLTKNKKLNANYNLEDFDAIPENSKANLEFSEGLLKKLEKKAIMYQNSLDYLYEEVLLFLSGFILI